MAGIIRNHPRKLIAVGGIITALVTSPYWRDRPLKTFGVQNIEKRYTSGGGSPTHLPATATRRGDSDNVIGNVEKSKGMGTKHWDDNIGNQKPEGSRFDKAWNKNNYGSEKGK